MRMPHRPLARQLFHDFGGEARDAADDEDQARERRRKAHVVEHGRQRAVDVDGHRLDLLGDRGVRALA